MRVYPKIWGICSLKKLLVSTISLKVVPLGTLGNCAKGGYFKGDGGN
jgi:hypothetical protein